MSISCSFDKVFLYPEAIPADVKTTELIDRQSGDTIIAQIGPNYQPSFVNRENNTIYPGGTAESVLFKNSSGNQLNGWILSPYSKFNGRTLLFLHGNAGNITTHFSYALPLVQKGFKVFLFDYSGFGFSEGEATREQVLEDANAALDYLVSRTDLKSKKLLIYGQSLGGHLAATMAATNQDKIDGLIIEGAFSTHKGIAANKAGLLGRWFVSEKYSGLEAIRENKKPVLIIHSVDDEVTPYEMGMELFEAANQPKSFYSIEKYHMAGPIYYSDQIAARIKKLTPM